MAFGAPPQPLSLYEQSSQFRNWRYSAEQLAELRQELNQSAVDRVKTKVEEERTTAEAAPTEKQPLPSEIQYLTVQDELDLVTFYLTKITLLAEKGYGFPDSVASTAMTYLKRFYLRNTCMDYHPKNVMLTCLFLATKTENHVISIAQFASKIKGTSPSSVLSLEFLVSQSLRFQYKVHHPLLAAYGILLDLQTSLPLPPSTEELQPMYKKVDLLLRQARLTDLEFLYLPSQIALAAFHLADEGLTESWLSVKAVLNTQEGLGMDEMRKVIAEIKPILVKAKQSVDLESVRNVDKRLRYCKNPEKDPNSALYKKRQAEAESMLEDKRAAKRAKEEVLDDPFGPPPSSIVRTDLPVSAQIDQGNKKDDYALKPIGTPPQQEVDRRVG